MEKKKNKAIDNVMYPDNNKLYGISTSVFQIRVKSQKCFSYTKQWKNWSQIR